MVFARSSSSLINIIWPEISIHLHTVSPCAHTSVSSDFALWYTHAKLYRIKIPWYGGIVAN